MKAHILFTALVLVALLAGCAGNTAVPQSARPAMPLASPSSTPVLPTISLRPATVSADKEVTVIGSGFPPGARVRAHLATANGNTTPQSYAEAIANADGKLAIAFTMPGQWPNGALITETDLMVVVATEDLRMEATAPISFQPAIAPQPTTTQRQPTPAPTVPIPPTGEPTARVNGTWLNVRSGPGVNYGLIASLKQDDIIPLLGRNDDGMWARIRLPSGQEGWVYTQYIQASVEIASLPVTLQPAQNPGLPASTASPVPAGEKEAAIAAAVSFYTQWASGPNSNGNLEEALQHVSKALADQIRADDSFLLRMLGVPSRPRYTEIELQRFDGTTALMRATLQLESSNRVVDTTLRQENGRWVIVQFQPVGQ